MTKNLKKFKASFVAGIILASIFVLLASSFSVNAEKAGGRGTIIEMERTDHNNGTLSPGKPVAFTFKVTYSLVPILPNIDPILYIPPTTVHLDVIGDENDWITAVLDRSTLQIKPDEPQTVTLTVSVTPEAPYIQDHELKIIAKAEEKPSWASSTCDISVTVTPDFLYFVSASARENFYTVSPPGSYPLQIDLQNLATYSVKFYFEISNIPKDWAVTAPNSMVVSPKSTGKVYVTVTPPYGFGHHDETIGFTVNAYAEPFPSVAGTVYEKSQIDAIGFQVRNLGFSLVISGAALSGLIFGIIALLVILIIISYFRKSKKEKTVEKKK